MTDSDRAYRTLAIEQADVAALLFQSRWDDSANSRLREAISSRSALPRTFKPVEVSFSGSTVRVEDLRGADLSGIEIGDYDLAYCALDYANFEHSRLVGTRLQYSRVVGASFQSATLEAVQGSPVDAQHANFSHARLISSYFAHSNFDGATTDSIEISDCDFTECSSPLTKYQSQESKFVYSATKNEAVVRRIVDYLEADSNRTIRKKSDSLNLKTGATKIGRVVAGSSHADYVVVVQSKPRLTAGGKIIKKQVGYKISAATTAFSVGDAVRIMSLELDARLISKAVIHKNSFLSKSPAAVPKLFKSPSWWILGRASSDESRGLEGAEA